MNTKKIINNLFLWKNMYMKVFFISTEKSCNKCLLLVLQIYLICVVNIAQIQFDLQENKA